MNEKMGVISPEGLQLKPAGGVSRHLDTLAGKTIGEVYNNHFKGEQMFRAYRRLLTEKFPGVKIITYDKFPIIYVGGDPASHKKTAEKAAALAKEWGCDAIITGNGGWGTCTPASVRPAAEAEKLGIPSVVVTTTGFTAIAKAAGKAQGVTGLRVAEYPGAVGVHNEALVEKNVETVLIDRIVSELTVPRRADGEDASVSERRPDAIVYEGTFDEINDHFREQLWSDELPVVPPTSARVEAFLQHTQRAPDEHIAILPQANLAATPRNIAANAVMAGCKPAMMPVLIAAVEALADNRYNLNNIGSTWGVLPFLLINGPAAKQLGIENGAQLVNKGANPSLGRALGLIIKNIAGYKLSRNYMGTFGYPMNFVIAENEAETPWEPFHVEHGFSKTDNTVTACGTVTWGWAPAIYGTEEKSAAQSALEFLSIEVTKKPCLARLVERGANGFQNMITFMIAPPVAKALAAAGYSKQKIRDYVYEHARVQRRELEFLIEFGHSEAFKFPDMVERGLLPENYLVDATELVRVLPSADVINIVVCGDPDRNRLMVLWGGYIKPVSKKIL